MQEFKKNYESLISGLGNDINLSSVLEFITYFRCDDVSLYQEFLSNYHSVGEYDSSKLIELYCKHNGISLNDENANEVFLNLANNIWNNNMSYHLTTSVSAKNIYNNGMDPSKKEIEVKEDIDSLASVLTPDGRSFFFPFALGDKDTYSYSSIPKLNVNYGKKPEWYLNLTLYNNGTVDDIMKAVSCGLESESDVAKEKMFDVVSKYHDLYSDSTRTLIVIPGLNPVLDNESLSKFDVKDVASLEKGIGFLLFARHSKIDCVSSKCVPGSDLMFIDVKTRSLVNFDSKEKSM